MTEQCTIVLELAVYIYVHPAKIVGVEIGGPNVVEPKRSLGRTPHDERAGQSHSSDSLCRWLLVFSY